MRIKKVYQGTVPENKILGTYTTSNTDTYSCNYINNCNTYSTSEVDTGKKWVDNKKIYRKVFTFSSLTNSADNDIGTISNLGTITYTYGMAKLGGDQYALPHVDYRDKEWNIGIHANDTFGKIYVEKGAYGTVTGASYVVVEYTKSS